MRNNRIILIIVVVLILILGISTFLIVGRTKVAKGELTNTIPAEVSSEELPPVKTESVVKTDEESTSGPTELVQEAELVVPAVRTELESTNPGEVNLTSGELQLVEFFAFW